MATRSPGRVKGRSGRRGNSSSTPRHVTRSPRRHDGYCRTTGAAGPCSVMSRGLVSGAALWRLTPSPPWSRGVGIVSLLLLLLHCLITRTKDADSPTTAKKRRADAKYIASIALADIAQYFHLPIREASMSLKIGVSTLKRRCREFGIRRWPHRKIKSLDSLIRDLREEVNQHEKENREAEATTIAKRKRMLETEKEAIQKSPSRDLMAETKRFRQDVFKMRHKIKCTSNR